ncbi:MAG TPA: small basic family protein [Armatimonadota bacterium]|jgi:small basic protein|nr:small basic family protein [Armatimonadota bacterium]
MAWLPVVGLVAGFLIIYQWDVTVPNYLASYLSLGTLAGLDSIFGGIRAGIEGKFHDDIFLSGFAVNTLLAAALAWLGDQIGVNLFLAAVVVLGGRVFLNLSLIRRYWLTKAAFSKKDKIS